MRWTLSKAVEWVDPPEGWRYGFPAPREEDYEAQLRKAHYPENMIPLALNHSRRYIGWITIDE